MSVAALLSDDYAVILSVAQVSDVHSFDGREAYDFFFEEELDASRVIWADGDYAIADVGYDDPTVMLFHRGAVVGFYFELMAWLDDEHRGRGLATQMILSYAERFGDDCFVQPRIKADCAMGFSPEGYDLHVRAREKAREMLDIPREPASGPAP
jgi:GNAT superfamily N-acetyltransferase